MGTRPQKASGKSRRSRHPFLVGALALLGVAGAGMGLFAPAVEVDMGDDQRIWDIADGEVFVVLLALLLALLHAVPSRQRRLWFPALLLWAGVAYPFLEPYVAPTKRGFLGRIRDGVGDITSDLAFSFDMVNYTWGIPLFLGGCVVLTLASALALR